MSSILCSKNNFDNAIKIGKFFINTEFIKKGEMYFYIVGEIFSHPQEDVVDMIFQKDTARLKKVLGEFCIICFDPKLENITLCGDKACRSLVFYNIDGFVGLDFWDAVNFLSLGIDDVDSLGLKEHVFFNTGLRHNTIFNNLKIVPPATLVEINTSSKEVLLEKYWTFKFKKSDKTTAQKMDEFDSIMNNAFQSIKKNNPKDSIYGIGISGGLDSRIIPYYADKNKLSLKSFIIGKEKPNRFLLSNDHYSSQKIVEYFKLDHQILEMDDLPFKTKLAKDVAGSPCGGAQLFKVIDSEKLPIDVLLTGASGFFVGASPNYGKVVDQEILYSTYSYLSVLRKKIKWNKIRKGLNAVCGFNIKAPALIYKNGIEGVVSSDDIESFDDSINRFYKNLPNSTNIEKIMNHVVFFLGQRNRQGSFESCLGRFKSYTPYYPFLVDFIQTLDEDEFVNRSFFENFIRVRLPFLADIRSQDHKAALSKGGKAPFFNRMFAMVVYVLRGNGVMNYKKWAKSKKFKIQYLTCIKENRDVLEPFFDVESLKTLYKDFEIESIVFENIIKYSAILKRIKCGASE